MLHYTVYYKVTLYSKLLSCTQQHTAYSKVDEIIKRSHSSSSLTYTLLIYVSNCITSGTAALLWLSLLAAHRLLLQNESRKL
jgi:c-di-GMP-related signal transduction protein